MLNSYNHFSPLYGSEQRDVGVTCFSAVRASRESQDGRKGRILLENTFANVNQVNQSVVKQGLAKYGKRTESAPLRSFVRSAV